MADNDKKGPRDISDLKARLGLKKQPGGVPGPAGQVQGSAPMPMVPAQGSAPASASRPGTAGLPQALTGIPAPGAVPPPPGFAAPPEPAASPPDPRRDPFAAQQAAAMAANLAAFYGSGPLPGDANAVRGEPLEKPRPWGLIGGVAGVAALTFIVGYATSRILAGRAEYNETTDHAARIRDEVLKMQKTVGEVAVLVQEANKERGKINFASLDKLKDLEFKEPEPSRSLFHTNYYSFEPKTVQQLFLYFNDVLVLNRQITDHANKSVSDKDPLEKFLAKQAQRADMPAIGVILDYSQSTPYSQLVQLVGAPFCPQGETCELTREGKKVPDATKMHIRFRGSLGGTPSERPLKAAPQQAVFPMTPTELQQQVLAGDANMLAYEAYRRRTKDILDSLLRIKDEQKVLVEGLAIRAKEPKLFSF